MSVRRIIMIALSVMLALVVAMPMASAQASGGGQDLENLTEEWWNWAFSTSPSPLEGEYSSPDPRCEGEYVDGVFFLAGAGGSEPVKRTCTVPTDTPILFPVVNVICSAAWDSKNYADPRPLDTGCAEPYTSDTIDPPSKWYATLDGQVLEQQRIASGLFQWTISSQKNPFGLKKGTFEAASDGLWVYLEEGLTAGEHTIVFGGTYKKTPFGSFDGARVTYHLTAQ